MQCSKLLALPRDETLSEPDIFETRHEKLRSAFDQIEHFHCPSSYLLLCNTAFCTSYMKINVYGIYIY